MNLRYKIAQFMYGRYGIDKLFYMLLILAVVLAAANIFLRSAIVQLLVYAIEVYALFRVFSRNHEARIRENRFVLGFRDNIRNKARQRRERKADSSHIYKKCPKCRATLRLPRRIGRHTTVCPKCNHQFKVTVRK